jgi:hypothetical protein
VFKATFSNISAISWRPVLVVEEAGAPQRKKNNHGQATGKLYHLQPRVECTLIVIYKAGHKHNFIMYWYKQVMVYTLL